MSEINNETDVDDISVVDMSREAFETVTIDRDLLVINGSSFINVPATIRAGDDCVDIAKALWEYIKSADLSRQEELKGQLRGQSWVAVGTIYHEAMSNGVILNTRFRDINGGTEFRDIASGATLYAKTTGVVV